MSNLRNREVIKCCEICDGAKIFVVCVGCGMELCESCARFELIVRVRLCVARLLLPRLCAKPFRKLERRTRRTRNMTAMGLLASIGFKPVLDIVR